MTYSSQKIDHNVHIKQLDLNFIVVIRLSREVLSAMKLSEIKIKSPTKKQQISTKREHKYCNTITF